MMSGSRLSLKASPRPMDYLMDTGNPTLNCTLDGVLKIGGVGAAHAVTQEAYSMMRKELPSPRQHMEKIVSFSHTHLFE